MQLWLEYTVLVHTQCVLPNLQCCDLGCNALSKERTDIAAIVLIGN